jgi:hypothetical protein
MSVLSVVAAFDIVSREFFCQWLQLFTWSKSVVSGNTATVLVVQESSQWTQLFTWFYKCCQW